MYVLTEYIAFKIHPVHVLCFIICALWYSTQSVWFYTIFVILHTVCSFVTKCVKYPDLISSDVKHDK